MKLAIETEILFRISLAIGDSVNLEQMCRKVLSETLRLLNASGAAIFQESAAAAPVCMLPRTLARSQAYPGLRARWPEPSQIAQQQWAVVSEGGVSHHLIDLPGFGTLLIERAGEPLAPGFMSSFSPLARKLAVACRACVSEQELAHQRQRLELATSAAELGVWSWNPVSGVLEWDDRCCDMHRVDPDRFDRGAGTWLDCFEEEDATRLSAALEAVRCGASDRIDEDLSVRTVGAPRRVLRVLGRAGIQGDEVAGIVFDVTKRREMTDALRQARDAAEEASRAKSEFLANMSHEIRTPMNGVLGMLDLAQDARDEKERSECLSTARSSAESLLAIINDILDFSKIEAGRIEIESVAFDLGGLLSQVMRTMAAQAGRKSLALRLELEPGLPSHLMGDPLRLRQILLNLLSNAIKFTHAGSVTIHVARRAGVPGERLVLSVIDTGIGIPLNKQALVFEAFAQQDSSTTRSYGGTGLGLSISSRLAELMGGGITLESEVDRGSAFRVELPLLRASATPDAREPDRPGEASTGPGLSVLLVEDHPVNQKVAQTVLERAGHRVTLVSNGIEAIEKVAEGGFDLVLMDMQMPVMGGVEAARLIRQMEQELGRLPVPIFAMTANAQEEDRSACLDAGMNDFLTKPLLPRVLREKIAAMTIGVPDAAGSVE